MKLFTLLITFISSSYLFAPVTSSCASRDDFPTPADQAAAVDTLIKAFKTDLSAYTNFINDAQTSGSTTNLVSSALQTESNNQLYNDLMCLIAIRPTDIIVVVIQNFLVQNLFDFDGLMASIEIARNPSNTDANQLMSDVVTTFCNEVLPDSVAFFNTIRSSSIFASIVTESIDGPNVCPGDDTGRGFPITGSLNFFA